MNPTIEGASAETDVTPNSNPVQLNSDVGISEGANKTAPDQHSAHGHHDPHRWAHFALACIHAALTVALLAEGLSHLMHAACEGGAAATYLMLFRAGGRA